MVNTSVAIILGILFLTFNNADVMFIKQKLTWRSHRLVKALLTTKWIQIIGWKEFVATTLDRSKKVFVVYVAHLGSKMSIYSAWKTQIALQVVEKVIIPAKYSDFSDVFSKESITELFKHFDINKHSINLKPDKQLFYEPISSLSLVKLEILKV